MSPTEQRRVATDLVNRVYPGSPHNAERVDRYLTYAPEMVEQAAGDMDGTVDMVRAMHLEHLQAVVAIAAERLAAPDRKLAS